MARSICGFTQRIASPQWEVPELVELGHPDWSSPRHAEFDVPAHVQDIAENSCDPVHFAYVHRQPDVPPSKVTVEDNGRYPSPTFRCQSGRNT